MAVQRLIHSKTKDRQTRRDITLERIRGNVHIHNDPYGKTEKFETMLIGRQSHLNRQSEYLGSHLSHMSLKKTQ